MRMLIVDGLHLFLRNLAVIKLMDAKGHSVGGFYGFLRSLASTIESTKPNAVFICWEGMNGSAKRRSLYKEYKQHRKPVSPKREEGLEYSAESAEENKLWQFSKLQAYLKMLPVYNLYADNSEADDVIAFLCHRYKEDQKIILSADRDFLQLVNDLTYLLSPIKHVLYDTKTVIEEYSVHPNNFLFFRALTGDSSDSIKGIKGLGAKTVIKLFPFLNKEEKVNLMAILKHAEENKESAGKYQDILENKDLIKRNLELMDLSNPMMNHEAISQIEYQIKDQETKMRLDLIGFQIQLMQDGITSINDRFLNLFKPLIKIF